MRISRFHQRWLFAAAFGLLPTTTTWAEDKPAADAKPADQRETLFKQLDKNNDGVVSSDEVSEDQKRLFTRLLRNDKNEDGKLSLEEWLAGTQEDRPARRPEGQLAEGRRPDGGDPRQEAEMIFKRADANGDGKVVIDEVPEDRRDRFAQMIERADSNGDKALTLEEFTKGYLLARGVQAPANPQSNAAGMPSDALLRLFDTDRDGKLSAAEVTAAGDALKKLDRDNDGSISREELGAGLMARAAQSQPGNPTGGRFGIEQLLARWKESDKNGDGKWTKDEVPERAAERFAQIDTNGDGVIDEAELKKMAEGFAQMAAQGGDFLNRMFEQADANKDGKLSKDEAPERMKENFDRLDRNKDGFIERDELRDGLAGQFRRREESKKDKE
jgi:Ca2+-binding EF-hand superfamily protein